MVYLIDTCIFVDHLRGKIRLSKNLAKLNFSISTISLGELLYGAAKSARPNFNEQKIWKLLDALNVNIVNVDSNIAGEYGRIKAELSRKGQKLEDFDTLIAATCKNFGYNLVSNNQKHFNRVTGLYVYNYASLLTSAS